MWNIVFYMKKTTRLSQVNYVSLQKKAHAIDIFTCGVLLSCEMVLDMLEPSPWFFCEAVATIKGALNGHPCQLIKYLWWMFDPFMVFGLWLNLKSLL